MRKIIGALLMLPLMAVTILVFLWMIWNYPIMLVLFSLPVIFFIGMGLYCDNGI